MPSDPSRQPGRDLAPVRSRAERLVAAPLSELLAAEECPAGQWRVPSAAADGGGHPVTEIADHVLTPAPSVTWPADRMVADNGPRDHLPG